MSADDKAAAAWNDYVSQQQEEKIEELERQLNAANERIQRLEDACDEAIAFCELLNPVGATPDTARLIAKNLRKAKESKP
jgi:hypothetical protein